MCQKRIIFSLIKNREVMLDVIESLKDSEFIKEVLKSEEVSLEKRIVSAEFYQELVDEGGQINYSQTTK